MKQGKGVYLQYMKCIYWANFSELNKPFLLLFCLMMSEMEGTGFALIAKCSSISSSLGGLWTSPGTGLPSGITLTTIGPVMGPEYPLISSTLLDAAPRWFSSVLGSMNKDFSVLNLREAAISIALKGSKHLPKIGNNRPFQKNRNIPSKIEFYSLAMNTSSSGWKY